MWRRSSIFVAILGTLLIESLSVSAPLPPPAPKPTAQSFAPDKLPKLDGKNNPVRMVSREGFRLEIDLSPQRVRVDVPERTHWRTDLDRIQEGDTIVVVGGNALLQSGRSTVASLPKGSRLRITQVKDDWLATAVLANGVSKTGWIKRSQAKLTGPEDPIFRSPADAAPGKFVSAALLTQKSKQFDDGLYAAVELAAQNGAGELGSKKLLLKSLTAALAKESPSKGAATIAAATRLGGQELSLPPALEASTRQALDQFNADALRSKPLGFYTWNRSLEAIFRQDRMLQTGLKGDEGVEAVVNALRRDADIQRTYARYLELVARLTNPWDHADLRSLASGTSSVDPRSSYRIFPPSTSHENVLVMRLYGNKPIPASFDLMNELIARIRSREIDLAPKGNSGWYDYQTFALEPLIRPETAAEASHLSFDDKYKELLTDLFKGALALARETHVKQLAPPAPAAAPDFDPPEVRKTIRLDLELSAEPLATHYCRRADGYRFIHQVLRDAFGAAALTQIHRQTADGPVAASLDAELGQMTQLFDGAATVAARQLGLTAKENQAAQMAAEAAAEVFLNWAATMSSDPDLSKDARMMVPVFYDQGRAMTKVWVFLGWSRRDVYFGLERQPLVHIYDETGKAVDDSQRPEIIWSGRTELLLYPVMAEVYVSKLLNREEFRKHCDVYQTRAAILSNLK